MDCHPFKTAKIRGVISLVPNTSARPHEHNVPHNRLLLGLDACSREDEILKPLQQHTYENLILHSITIIIICRPREFTTCPRRYTVICDDLFGVNIKFRHSR